MGRVVAAVLGSVMRGLMWSRRARRATKSSRGRAVLVPPRHDLAVELGPVELLLDAVEGVVADDAARAQVDERAPLRRERAPHRGGVRGRGAVAVAPGRGGAVARGGAGAGEAHLVLAAQEQRQLLAVTLGH